jgi:hypothetical protein
MQLPGTFKRQEVFNALDQLGLTEESVSSVHITGTEIEVGLFVGDADGDVIVIDGERAQVFYTIPIDG